MMKFDNSLKIIFILLFIFPILHACNQTTHFEKTKWLEKENFSYPYREIMLDDLVTNYELTGLSFDQLKNMLGQPDSLGDNSNEIVYRIKVEYDLCVDPVYVKNLIFEFDADSTVTAFRIEEYQRIITENKEDIATILLLRKSVFVIFNGPKYKFFKILQG